MEYHVEQKKKEKRIEQMLAVGASVEVAKQVKRDGMVREPVASHN